VQSLLTVFIKTEATTGVGLAGIPGDQSPDDAADDVRLGNGLVASLAPGEDIETVNPSAPNPAFEMFMSTLLDHMGSGIELPGELWIKKFTTSYSAARAAFIEAWKFFRASRHWLVSVFCQPVYEWAISEAVLRGLLDAPGFAEDPLRRAAWLRAQWIGDAAGQIHPHQEVAAAASRVDLGVSSIEEEAAELRGNDFWEVHEQRAYERRIRVQADLEPGTPAGPGRPDPADEGDPPQPAPAVA
jgi:capsid protein